MSEMVDEAFALTAEVDFLEVATRGVEAPLRELPR